MRSAGSGLPKIKQGWTDLGRNLHLYDSHEPYAQSITELSWAVNGGLNGGVNDSELTAGQQQILVYLRNNPNCTVQALVELMGKPARTIERIGSAKTGQWKVLQ
jgi:hypothetical protein